MFLKTVSLNSEKMFIRIPIEVKGMFSDISVSEVPFKCSNHQRKIKNYEVIVLVCR